MVGGETAPTSVAQLHVKAYHGELTVYVMIVAIVASCGGLLHTFGELVLNAVMQFGYDIGIAGGVTAMASFQEKFFPDIYQRTLLGEKNDDPYCTYNDQVLQLFASSLFLAGAFSSFLASYVTRKYGRKATMVVAGTCYLLGSFLNAGAQNLAMLVVGRIFLGFGVGNSSQVVPLYLSEMAPYKWRGALNQLFQLTVNVGILVAELVNYGVQDWDNGWRLSLGLAAVPATILFLAGVFLPESPNSLIERGYDKRGRYVLQKLRGTDDVDVEYDDIKESSVIANSISVRQSWRVMFTRAYAPMLIVGVLIPTFQQLTGIDAFMFYVPIIFNSLGSARSIALMNTCIVGAVNVCATCVAIFSVDRWGRRAMFFEGGVQQIVAQIITGVVLAVEFGKYNTANLPPNVAIGVLVVICVYVAGFGWSWGPLGWLVPSEIQTMETRAVGMSAAVTVNFLFSFVIGQSFLSMLCSMKWGVFLFFAGWVVIATIFIYFMLPETKGVPIEETHALFAEHPIWRRVMGPAADEIIERERNRSVNRAAAAVERANSKKALNGVGAFMAATNSTGSSSVTSSVEKLENVLPDADLKEI